MWICCAASVRCLYHDGLTIKGVQKVLREQGVRYVAEFGRGEVTLAREAAIAAPGSNVHPFPGVAVQQPALSPAQRQHLETLLAELIELKDRLLAAKQKRAN